MRSNDEEYRRAAVILTEVAKSNERLIALAQALRADSEVREVNRGLDCRNYESGLTLEEYVEAELKDGTAVCWWLDVHQQADQWLIRASILLNGDAGQKVIKEITGGTASSVDEFASRLQEVTDELVSNSSVSALSSHASANVEEAPERTKRDGV